MYITELGFCIGFGLKLPQKQVQFIIDCSFGDLAVQLQKIEFCNDLDSFIILKNDGTLFILSALSVLCISGTFLEVRDVRHCDAKEINQIFEQRCLELRAFHTQLTQEPSQSISESVVEISENEDKAFVLVDTSPKLQFIICVSTVDENISYVKHLLSQVSVKSLQKVLITTDVNSPKLYQNLRRDQSVPFTVVELTGKQSKRSKDYSLSQFKKDDKSVIMISTTQLAVNHSVQADLCIIFDLPSDAKLVAKLYEQNQKIVIFYDSISDKDKSKICKKTSLDPQDCQHLN
ncbi:hypothetical protein GEMRC1_001932 [Eukaryota sp. GEM-RC1]